jgi:two-component system response regulator RpfG
MQTVLIIDDQALTRMVLKEFAGTIGPDVEGKAFETPSAALDWVNHNPVAMVLVDYRMPGMNGLEFTRRLRKLPAGKDVPVVMITALTDPDKAILYEALNVGVVDFLSKPIDYSEWRGRCRNILKLHRCHPEGQVNSEMAELLLCITQSVSGRNPKRLARISRHIAEQIGLSSKVCEQIQQAAPLIDLGLFWVPNNLLSRPSTLLQEEHKVIQGHTIAGYHLLQKGNSEVLLLASKIALSHHEHFDGTGYPHGFAGRDVPLAAERVFDYLKKNRGKKFDPDCVDAFFQRLDEALLSGGEQAGNLIKR